MIQTERGPVSETEMFKALGDPVRWSIIGQIAAVDELACSKLEDTLPVSKPTISYHTKILAQAGIISVRKEGRNFYYTLQREAMQALAGDLWAVAPGPRPVRDGKVDLHQPPGSRRRTRPTARPEQRHEYDKAAGGEGHDAILLTW